MFMEDPGIPNEASYSSQVCSLGHERVTPINLNCKGEGRWNDSVFTLIRIDLASFDIFELYAALLSICGEC